MSEKDREITGRDADGRNVSTALGKRLRSARKRAGLTQEQLAGKLSVSRQAVTKWEADKGMPDVGNLKRLSELLGVSVDYLLEGGDEMDLSVTREKICLDDYAYRPALGRRWVKKTGQKDMAVIKRYPGAEIHCLTGRQILTKEEKAIDTAIGFLTTAPFGIPELVNGIKNVDREFYLVNAADQQFLVTVTDEWMESRQLAERITAKRFEIEGFSFVDCGVVSEAKKG